MKFELHSHSQYSRGSKIPHEAFGTPAEIIKVARMKGLAGVAITEHTITEKNLKKSWYEAREEAKKQGIIFIPGMEIISSDGHVIGLGLSDFIADNLNIIETVEKIHEQGGIAVAPHPFDIKGEGLKDKIKHVDIVEVFNALNLDRISNIFSEIKANKLEKPKISCTDSHSLEMVGISSTKVNAYDIDSLLKELKKGKTELEKNYVPLKIVLDWTRERLTLSYMIIMNHISNNYSKPKAWLAINMMRRFIFSKSNFWYALAKTGVGISTLYSGVKLLSYY